MSAAPVLTPEEGVGTAQRTYLGDLTELAIVLDALADLAQDEQDSLR